MKKRMYSANSLKKYWYALNRIIKQCGKGLDMICKENTKFKKSQQAFLDAMKELKVQRKSSN